MRKQTTEELRLKRYKTKRIILPNKDFFKEFRLEHPEYKDMKDTDIRLIIKTFNAKFANELFNHYEGLDAPQECFRMMLGRTMKRDKKYTYTKDGVDKQTSSDTYLAKAFFLSSKKSGDHQNVWGFKSIRSLARKISKDFRGNFEMYPLVYNKEKAMKLLEKFKYLSKMKFANETTLRYYNEFEL